MMPAGSLQSESLPQIASTCFLSGLTALALTVVFMPLYLKVLKCLGILDRGRKGDSERLDELHALKCNTPTMGGVVPLFAMIVSTVVWVDEIGPGVRLVFATSLAFAAVGAWDDIAKLRASGHGLLAREKLALLLGISVVSGIFFQDLFGPHGSWPIFALLPFWAAFVVTGTANSVNLTDGLDGLAGGCLALAAAGLAVGAAVSGYAHFSHFLDIEYVVPGRSISILCAALSGASVGFLFFNSHPAKVFMGDTGSLSLGSALALSALLIGQELLLVVLGGVFVVEAFSVLLQVFSYKMFGKRIFLIAPLHHHFEFKGHGELTVTTRFWLFGAGLSLSFVACVLWV